MVKASPEAVFMTAAVAMAIAMVLAVTSCGCGCVCDHGCGFECDVAVVGGYRDGYAAVWGRKYSVPVR